MKKVWLVTQNNYKFRVMSKLLEGSGVELVQERIETPEIQSWEVGRIAEFSAMWAADVLGKAVLVNDSGYFIEALNGFPGPFVKYVAESFAVHDWLRLMEGKKDRGLVVRSALAYCQPGERARVKVDKTRGRVAETPGESEGETTLHRLFIPDGFDRPQSEIAEEEMIQFWGRSLKIRERVLELVK